MDISPGQILIVDDEKNIRAGLRDVLKKAGHSVREAANGKEALRLLESFPAEVALVDIRMPGMTGIELLKAVREKWPHISVIILTGNGTLESAMSAVKMGARDYLLKPAQPSKIYETINDGLIAARKREEQEKLISSLQGSLQRLDTLGAGVSLDTPAPSQSHCIRLGELVIDQRAHIVQRKGEDIPLSPTEFEVLVVLASHAGEALDYVTLVEEALGYRAEKFEARELIKRHIFAIRHKLEPDPANPRYIINVRGIGYRMAAHPHDLPHREER